MPLINFKINLDLTQSDDFVIAFVTGKTKFAVADTRLYVLVVTLLTFYKVKLLKQQESGFKKKN